MPDLFPEITNNLKRKIARTEELFARSISLWNDLEHAIQLSHTSIDEWKKKAETLEGFNGLFFPAHLEVMKRHIELAKQRNVAQHSYSAHLTSIPPSRLIKRV